MATAAQSEVGQVFNSIGSFNNPNVGAQLIYDPNFSGYRLLQTTDLVNLNLLGAPVLQSIYPFSSGISNNTVYTGIVATTGIGYTGSTGILIPGNSTRRGYYIQNLSNNPLYVLFSGGVPTPNMFNLMLNGTGSNYNTTWSDSYVRYSGSIGVSGNSLYVIGWSF
jgi:hypothetical protein